MEVGYGLEENGDSRERSDEKLRREVSRRDSPVDEPEVNSV
jgi:hypothetical protein